MDAPSKLLLDCLHEDPGRITADRLTALDPTGWDALHLYRGDRALASLARHKAMLSRWLAEA